jgi:hypothetical protein
LKFFGTAGTAELCQQTWRTPLPRNGTLEIPPIPDGGNYVTQHEQASWIAFAAVVEMHNNDQLTYSLVTSTVS